MNTKKISKKSSPKRLSVSAPASKKEEAEYDKDLFKWTKTQANLLQKGEFEKLDIDHLREEIESLGISLQRALESYLANLLMHKLKIKYQPEKQTNSWNNSIKNATFQIDKLIKKNPSLKTYLPEIFKDAYYTARLEASSETELEEKTFPQECPWILEEILPFINKEKA
jgi:hypothetical protein